MKLKILTVLAALITALSSRGEIVYVNGPSFPILGFWGTGDLDLNNDGVSDFTFWSSGMLCTQDIPTSGCGWPFYVRTGGSNEVLTSGNDFSPQPLGERIGSEAPSAATWIIPGGFYGAGISYWWYSLQGRVVGGQLVHSGWSGGVADVGVGYLGVRFYTSDGLHYGWIRVRLPRQVTLNTEEPSPVFGLEMTPIVVDWAYETHPDTAILAGAGIDSDNDGVWDLADQCSDTPAGEAVDANGCSISQLVPCDGPWKNHGEYVARVIATVAQFQRQRLITKAEAREIVKEAARSDCGKQRAPRPPHHSRIDCEH